jgi:hypothetical protein
MLSRGGLTDLKVRNLKPDKAKRREIPDGKQAGTAIRTAALCHPLPHQRHAEKADIEIRPLAC